MNEKVITILRNTRTALQILTEPIDHFARFMNYKKGYPPLWIRQKVGGLNDFEGSGGEYMAYLKLLCDLKPGMIVLDIGCGCGLMCLPVNENPTLPQYLGPSGRYVGIDIDKTSIDWCNRNIRRKYPNCQFKLAGENLYEYRFDVILCKSLFTHLSPNGMAIYLDIIKDTLVPNGKCLATFFLLNKEEPKGKFTFKYSHMEFSYERDTKPDHAIAYDEDFLGVSLKRLGFTYDIHHGSWKGNNKGLSFQDIIILRR